MKIIGYTTTYNVSDIVNIVMPYVEMLGYDKFVVYDNMSSDDTVEKLSRYPFIEVREWNTGGKMDEIGKRNLEVNAFEECRGLVDNDGEDIWMTWTDFDEVIYYFYDLPFKEFLTEAKRCGYNCFFDTMIQPMLPIGYDREKVNDFIKSGRFPHEYDGIVVNHQYSKPVLFHINLFDNIYFIPGNHFALSEDDNVKNMEHMPLSILHLKYFFHDAGERRNEEYAKKESVGYNHYASFDKCITKRLIGSSYPISHYFEKKWDEININRIFMGNNKSWGKIVWKEFFYKTFKE